MYFTFEVTVSLAVTVHADNMDEARGIIDNGDLAIMIDKSPNVVLDSVELLSQHESVDPVSLYCKREPPCRASPRY